MTTALEVEFAKQFPGGPAIRAAWRVPADTFSVTILFGPSGSGKTTVLRCLAGLERPESGFIRYGDTAWFDAARAVCLPPQQRDVGYLFQEYALFPHLTVAGNVAYGLGGLPAAERRQQVQKLLDLLGLVGLEGRYPRQLSGGQQQRVALARAVARRPQLLLLDEPLSALDAPTREQLRHELRRWLTGLGVPTLLVTHDRVEAVALGDRVVVMDRGRSLQTGPVHEVFSRPAHLEVARVVGVETLAAAKVVAVDGELATVAIGDARLCAPRGKGTERNVYVSIRAEDVTVQKGQGGVCDNRNHLAGVVRTLVREGPLVRLCLDCGFALGALISRRACDEMRLREGEPIQAVIEVTAVHLIPWADLPTGGARSGQEKGQ
jgi:molybdate transport system ATP-binding protein